MKNYREYEGRPVLLKGEDHGRHNRVKEFDLVPATMFSLLEDLVPGSAMMEAFLADFEAFQADPDAAGKYGAWFSYPECGDVVHFAPKRWHQLALLARNSILLRNPTRNLSWTELRMVFDRAVIAVTGCSVGSNAAHAIVRDIRPGHCKIADPKEYHLTNANRVHLSYRDFGRNKAVVTAGQMHAIDPYLSISVFKEGVHPGNCDDFLAEASVVIEECDDPDIKITIREKARARGIPVVMVTDLGSAVQLDVRRFDRDRTLPIAACGVSDARLFEARDACRKDPNRENFYEFMFVMIGRNHVHVPEFKAIIMKEESPVFGGVPQLGSTAMMAGGMAAEAASRILLGFELPERMFIHKFSGLSIKEGVRL